MSFSIFEGKWDDFIDQEDNGALAFDSQESDDDEPILRNEVLPPKTKKSKGKEPSSLSGSGSVSGKAIASYEKPRSGGGRYRTIGDQLLDFSQTIEPRFRELEKEIQAMKIEKDTKKRLKKEMKDKVKEDLVARDLEKREVEVKKIIRQDKQEKQIPRNEVSRSEEISDFSHFFRRR